MRWCTESTEFLKDNFNVKSNKELAEILGRSAGVVAKKIHRLGLKRDYIVSQPDLEAEVWRVFPEKDKYLVSNLGRFRNKENNRLLKPWYSSSDYYYLDIEDKTYLAHRIVAITWVENTDPKNKTEVNHIKGKKDDFRPSQLEWVTPKENSRHAHDSGLMRYLSGENNPNAKLSREDVAKIRSSTTTREVLAQQFGVSKTCITKVKTNQTYI